MDYEQIRYERDGKVARVILNRPQYRNAQSRRLLREMDHAFAAAAEDPEVVAIVLLGEGDHFSAGHDLGTPEQKADIDADPYEEGIRGRFKRSSDLFVEFGLRWRNLPKPTIAGVQGYCIFGGWMIASSMDVIIASDDSLFLGANFQYFSMPWDLGPRKTKELLFESRFIDGHEAMEFGLVNRVVPRADLEAEVMEYARRVAENDPFQLRMTKLAVNQAQDAQGFSSHIVNAHPFHLLSSMGEGDPGYALKKPEGQRRRPMVQRAIENREIYLRKKAQQSESQQQSGSST